ncbi:hypothetical protein M407DRAFT_31943 [Tulasnella calospora MUT 4182]|uniref:Uncharacterized protein n=1 Tax=Tulasnella calospora MUT 4182 TaxID=1051891 RepID=A0A0C3Q5M1_9AGAM|nr:hypothetical protein M407DRAFT_31943 [Tulasnella calospora MUT 4182]
MSFSDLSEMSDVDFKSLTLHELSGITATSSNERPKALAKHHEFYVKDLIKLKVQNTLFRVEGRLLAASPLFHAIMKENENLCGASDDCVLISNVSILQMESLLHYIYYPAGVKKFWMQRDRVVAAFQIVEKLGFKEHHQYLLGLLKSNITPERFDLLTRINFARQCHIMEWITQAYSEIASREDGLSEKEAKELGLEKTLALCRIREKLSALRAAGTVKEDDEGPLPVDKELSKEVSKMVASEACLKPDFESVPSPSLSHTTTNEGSRHAEFYFTDEIDLVTLKVQEVLFRIPVRSVKGAEVINDLITATPQRHPISTDDSPLEIDCEALTILEFESFLRIITASHCESIESKLSFREWAQAIRVAKLLKHETGRNHMLGVVKHRFKEQDPIDLIEFANEHDLEDWLPDQYARLATRTARITEVEMRRLGYKAVSEIAHQREAGSFQRGQKKGISDTVEEFKRQLKR